ncbi:AP-3 complex subunit sigma-2 [Trachymyrmex septentrionalis]|uniref:AP-3 complex subunit sigma-2 n=1 Tax=Trachymyrmex septentrionalis TaxID=34720 RepID=A0A195F7C9_9HYME|nr:AP-3 complex subunit sigma-2 [Trachymyrmex septentrionalis]
MIKAILVFNNHGKPRLSKFYQYFNEDMQQQIIKETFQLVSKRDDNVCNFLEGGSLIGGSDYKLIYRHYATLYFVFCVDSSESELGILDLIQVFVETLDKCFENVCELDLIFHVDKVHYILNELVMGGMVLETNMTEILTRIEDQNKLEKQEVRDLQIWAVLFTPSVCPSGTSSLSKSAVANQATLYNRTLLCVQAGITAAPARAVSAVKNMNIPQQIKDMKLPDLPQAIKDLKF